MDLTGLLAKGAGTEITASGIKIAFGGVGDILAEALNGGHVTLNGGAILDILNSGGNEGLRAIGWGSDLGKRHHRDRAARFPRFRRA